MIADLILTLSSIGFVSADLRQGWKLFKNHKYSTNGFSKWHFRLKIASLCGVIIAYGPILHLPFALITAICQLTINIYIFGRIGGFKI